MIECVSNDIDLLIEKYRGINNISNYAARFKDDIIKLYYLNKGAAINQIKNTKYLHGQETCCRNILQQER